MENGGFYFCTVHCSQITVHFYRRVAQLAEHRSPKPVVAGSRPVSPARSK